MLCWVTTRDIEPMGLVERSLKDLVASSLSQPGDQDQLWVHCLPENVEEKELRAGTMVASFSAMAEEDVVKEWPTEAAGRQQTSTVGQP